MRVLHPTRQLGVGRVPGSRDQCGHGHGSHDDQRYVPPAELAAWAERDPLVLWERRARAEAGWTDEQQRQLVESVDREVAEALERALAAPYPSTDDLAASVFA